MEDKIIVDDHHMNVEEALNPISPENLNVAGSRSNVDWLKDMLKEVTINTGESQDVDLERLRDMTDNSDKGSSQLAYLMKHWEYKRENAARLLRDELDRLSKQREEAELKRLEILEEEQVEADRYTKKKCDSPVESNKGLEIDAEYDTIVYWKQRAVILEKLLKESRQREQILLEKLDESIKNMEQQSTPVEELSQLLKRADNFIHFVLQNAPITLGHMDKELRYRFIYNHYPSFKEEDFIGKTDTEIFSGAGVKESQDFKREVLERGLPAKREITFETELFGSKTFLLYVEPVFNKVGETIGVNYVGMDVTDQVRKRAKMARFEEEIAVQKAIETELNKTIHITEETMRAKQMLATMSHEIQSPLSGIVSMAKVLVTTTKLDKEQRQLLDVMISSGDSVLQLIKDILDLSKVESGVMSLEATKFRPREVVRHVLQTAAASLKKMLTLEGYIADDVPIEVIGDVLKIRQILTNLVSPDEIGASGESQSKDEVRHAVTFPTVWIRCDVYDTGIGIPEHALPTLFKKCMQANADHTHKHGGTGLGLAICKQLVELMGGHMTVSSKEHHGSTFTIVLPVSNKSDDQSDDPDELPAGASIHEDATTADDHSGYFQFQPRTLSSSMLSLSGDNLASLSPTPATPKELVTEEGSVPTDF